MIGGGGISSLVLVDVDELSCDTHVSSQSGELLLILLELFDLLDFDPLPLEPLEVFKIGL